MYSKNNSSPPYNKLMHNTHQLLRVKKDFYKYNLTSFITKKIKAYNSISEL